MGIQLSSLDMHFLLKELKELEGSRVDKVYNHGKESVYIQFHKSGVGKKILRIVVGKSVFFAVAKSIDETPSGFCMALRKHLEGKFIDSIVHLEPERIFLLSFKSKDDVRKLYLEFFGKGNVILCSDVIIDCLIKHKFRDRAILPKEVYKHPSMEYNVFNLKKIDVADLLKNSKKDKVVSSLAVELGLGGVYSEEVCLLSGVDKSTIPKKINEDENKKLINAIKKILKSKNKAQIVFDDKEVVGVVPVDLEIYKGYSGKKFSSFSEALDEYFTKELKLVQKEDSAHVKKIDELKRIIEEQKETLTSMEKKEIENREKGEIIYNNYALIKEVLDEVNKASKKHSWEEIKKKLKGHKVVKDLDVKDKMVVVEV
jgi:predicted ribosome quality control (RQC) complex YloA/Tae2 family protein